MYLPSGYQSKVASVRRWPMAPFFVTNRRCIYVGNRSDLVSLSHKKMCSMWKKCTACEKMHSMWKSISTSLFQLSCTSVSPCLWRACQIYSFSNISALTAPDKNCSLYLIFRQENHFYENKDALFFLKKLSRVVKKSGLGPLEGIRLYNFIFFIMKLNKPNHTICVKSFLFHYTKKTCNLQGGL